MAMKTLTTLATSLLSVIILAIGIMLGWQTASALSKERIVEVEVDNQELWETILSHKQQTWLWALEWCESSGTYDKVNWNDKDGTPSYYSFQFKPDTFKGYGEKYDLINKGLSIQEIMLKMEDYTTAKSIVAVMITDPSVKWSNEFPGCVKKIGTPPTN